MADEQADAVVEHPTWMGDVRSCFSETDIQHMSCKGIDLSSYEAVVGNAVGIYAQTQSGAMPPDGPRWSPNKVQTFLNWITDNYPVGAPAAVSGVRGLFAEFAAAPRVRKEITMLDAGEVATLRQAFEGVMARDPSAPDSYFAIAGIHWFPAIDHNPNFHCLHHENRFLAWHRIHLKRFEEALRSVPGCGDVTLPYWDITSPLPARNQSLLCRRYLSQHGPVQDLGRDHRVHGADAVEALQRELLANSR